MEGGVANVFKRLDDHDARIRQVERDLAVLPRIEKKLDRLIEADHGASFAVAKEKASAYSKRVKSLEKSLDKLEKLSAKNKENWDRYKIIFGIISTIVTLASVSALLGIEVSALVN